MKKVTLGRARDCSVVIEDTSDVVSRHQAVIQFSFFGKMTIYDTSANGTFVNGTRMRKNEGKVVTRKDDINFGGVWKLDWGKVSNPYRGIYKLLLIGVPVVALCIVAAIVAAQYMSTESSDVADADSTVLIEERDSTNEAIANDIYIDEKIIDEETTAAQPATEGTTKKNNGKVKDVGMAEDSLSNDNAGSDAAEAPLIY